MDSFAYYGKAYILEAADWVDKPGFCDLENRICPLYSGDGKDHRCESTLAAHTCKHVVKGNDAEKSKYREIVSEWNKDDTIPDAILSSSDSVINNYENLSLELLKNPTTVSVSGQDKYIRIVCDGSGKYDGVSDFLGFFKKPSQLSLCSSYFNMSSSDIFVMYRLVYQRYYEKRSQGVNVSPMLKIKGDLPNVDYSFDQARLFYRSNADENYSFGAIYYFLWSKYVKQSRSMGNYERPDIKIIEPCAAGGTLMEYIKVIAGDDFIPDVVLDASDSSFFPKIVNLYYRETGGKYNRHTEAELSFIRELLDRQLDSLSTHYNEKVLGDIANFLSENEKEDNSVGAVADYTSFALTYNLMKSFATLYVIDHIHRDMQKSLNDYTEYIRERFDNWKKQFNSIQSRMNSKLFNDWMMIFNDLLQLKTRRKELENMIK